MIVRILTIQLVLVMAALGRDVSVNVTPHNPPVRIPATGGFFDYCIDVANNDTASTELDVWTTYSLPGGGSAGPIYGPVPVGLPGVWTGSSCQLSQYVAESMPTGEYRYRAYAGRYPDTVWAGDSFEFEKTPERFGWYSQESGTDRFLTAVHFPHPDTGWAVGVVRTILRTTDGGSNWYSQWAPNFTQFADVFFHNPRIGWAIGDLGIIQHTTNSGDSWFQQESGVSQAGYLNGLYFSDSLTGWIVGGKPWTTSPPYRFILHTVNGGNYWDAQLYETDEYPLNAIHFIDDQRGWACGQGGVILRTTDAGANWSEQSVGVYELRDITFSDDSTGWAVGFTGAMLKSTDAGATWVPEYPDSSRDFTSILFTSPDTGWAAGGTGSGALVIHTTNGGDDWSAQNPAAEYPLFDIFCIDGFLGWTVGAYGVIDHTTSGGRIQVGLEERRPGDGHGPGPRLRVNSSNPFARTATVDFVLPRAGRACLKAYDATGRLVAILADGEYQAGTHQAALDGRGLPAGSYLLRLEAGGGVVTGELVLAK